MLKSKEVITELENSFDVNSMYYKGLRVWPLVRSNLIAILERPEYKPAQEKPQGNLCCSSILPDKEQLAALSQYCDSEFIFISRPEEHQIRISGRFYNPWIDPYIDIIRDRHSFAKLENLSDKARQTAPRFVPTVFLKTTQTNFCIPSARGSISNFENLHSLVLSLCQVDICELLIVRTANIAEQYKLYYLEVLSQLRPKVVPFVCYYGVPAMGLIWACRELNIISVDLQHGYHAGHLYYENWSRIPSGGYELLPDIFHVWSKAFKEDIEETQPVECQHHRAIVGSNAWMYKAVHREHPIEQIDDVNLDFLAELNKWKKVMLVTLQPLDDTLPKHLLEAIKNLPDNWLWLMRCHPDHKDRKSQTIEIMDANGIRNYEVENATACPLFLLLEHTDHHLTAISSVCLEALLYGVPTTFVCQEAYERYGKHIDRGFFNCVPSSTEDLMRFLCHEYETDDIKAIGGYFFDMGKDTEKAAFETILEHSSGREFNPMPGNPRALNCNWAGMQLMEQGDLEKAMHSFWKAVKAEPECTDYINNLGAVCSCLGRNDDAAKCMEAALRINPEDERTLNNCRELVKAGVPVNYQAFLPNL